MSVSSLFELDALSHVWRCSSARKGKLSKLLISCRSKPEWIRQQIKHCGAFHINLNKSILIAYDVQLFIEREVVKLSKTREFNNELTRVILEALRLAETSNYLWVCSIIKQLHLTSTRPGDVHDILISFPRDVAAVYKEWLLSVAEHHRARVSYVLRTVAAACRPLELSEIVKFVSVKNFSGVNISQAAEDLVSRAGPLLEIHNGFVYLMHEAIGRYLRENVDDKEIQDYVFDERQVHGEMANKCFSEMVEFLNTPEVGGKPPSLVEGLCSTCKYPILWWSTHVKHAGSGTIDLSHRFLSDDDDTHNTLSSSTLHVKHGATHGVTHEAGHPPSPILNFLLHCRVVALFVELLNSGRDPTHRDAGGFTAFHTVCGIGEYQAFQALFPHLERGEELWNTIDNTGRTPLISHIATIVRKTGGRRKKSTKVDTSRDFLFGASDREPLHESVKHLDVLKSIVRHCSTQHINSRDHGGLTALLLAAAYRLPKVARILLEHGADPNIRFTHLTANRNGASPLHEAAKHWSGSLVRLLIQHGASCTSRDEKRRTRLHYIALWCYVHAIRKDDSSDSDSDSDGDKDRTSDAALIAEAHAVLRFLLGQMSLTDIGMVDNDGLDAPAFARTWEHHAVADFLEKTWLKRKDDSWMRRAARGLSALTIE